jgi:hypothetical protein
MLPAKAPAAGDKKLFAGFHFCMLGTFSLSSNRHEYTSLGPSFIRAPGWRLFGNPVLCGARRGGCDSRVVQHGRR